MMRNIYLEGELGDRYGRELTANVDSVRDAFRLIEANYPDFKTYLVSCHEKDIGFTVDVAGKAIEKEEDLIFPIQSGDIVISPIPAGSKSGGAKILAAVAIIGLMFVPGGAALIGAASAGGTSIAGYVAGAASLGVSAGIAGTVFTIASTIALNLAMTGLQQLMAPDPATDADEPTSYMFNGSEQNVIEGDPVPILYGELRVPGRPIAFSVVNNSRTYGSGINYGINNDAGNSAGAPTNYGLEIDYNSYQS
jgi:predicted phage tail protein